MCRINYCHSFFVIRVLGGIMRRLVSVLLCMFAVVVAPLTLSTRAWATDVAPIINVKYVHDAIRTKWGLDIPYNAGLTNPSAAANMRYVLGMVDRANARFNIETHYGTGPYATSAVANRTTANRAIEKLVDKPSGYPFIATTTPDTTGFWFKLSASGTFYVDWGDGTVDTIEKNDTSEQEFGHGYETAGTYVVKLGGRATGYNQDKELEVLPTSLDDDVAVASETVEHYNYVPVISFADNSYLAKIEGSLGKIFPTLPGGIQPRFVRTFSQCSNLSGTIPDELFSGISGAPVPSMFDYTFASCGGLSAIPEKLFAGISGAPAEFMFYGTFAGCDGLGAIPEKLFASISGAPAPSMFADTFSFCNNLSVIPEKLFANISGAPAPSMFDYTFANCGNLSAIPEKLFASISGAPATGMFRRTFERCRSLTTIPEKLFAGISGAPADGMFDKTFYGCDGLTGAIPEKLFAGISGAPAPSMFQETFESCSSLSAIPGKLFAGISGAPADSMFYRTFGNCKGLTAIPENLFAGISGAPARNMFGATFYNCDGLTGQIPSGLFGNISGAPAESMFYSTFSGCSGLTGQIPSGLFGDISGAPASYMFNGTFYKCKGLTAIPENLFGNISGAPADYMFNSTFEGCSGLTGEIPLGLLGDISGSAVTQMFYRTFQDCSGLTGPSVRTPDGTPLYQVFPINSYWYIGDMYKGAYNLSDYCEIPSRWGGGAGSYNCRDKN